MHLLLRFTAIILDIYTHNKEILANMEMHQSLLELNFVELFGSLL